jgi:hypothetical protein
MRPLFYFSFFFVLLTQCIGFPPMPYYTLFGTVRDQVGEAIVTDSAEILLYKDGIVAGRAPISRHELDHNYELKIRLDQNRFGSNLYTHRAIAQNGTFSLAVEMNGALYYPIEASGSLRPGNAGERSRLDLTLGEDIDRDGLPDTWEAWQLYQAGLYPDSGGSWDLSLLNAQGDYDGDGVSNRSEYIAGTFAGDASEYFYLEIKEQVAGQCRLEYFSITGKVYYLEQSKDVVQWDPVEFQPDGRGDYVSGQRASISGIQTIWVNTNGESKVFYRLNVR